jgi:hypothetical protein
MKIMKTEDLIWLSENYIEGPIECRNWILSFELTTESTQDAYLEALRKLRSVSFEKCSIFTHLKMIADLSRVGLNASQAGERMREILSEKM